jgi:prophage tail gpP-like protein
MSGTAINTPVATPSDDVSIIVGNQTIAGWEDVTINRGIERMPASFDITLT